MEHLKIVTVGDGAVGKTSMLMVYAQNTFPGDYTPTVFDNMAVNSTIDGRAVNLSLWDTAGQEDYARLRPLSYPHTDVFLICFSTIHQTSFENVKSQWLPEVRHHAPSVPIVLVGTKVDQRDNAAIVNELAKRGQQAVAFADGLRLAKDIGAYQYVECSALRQRGVHQIFDAAVRSTRKPLVPLKPKRALCAIM